MRSDIESGSLRLAAAVLAATVLAGGVAARAQSRPEPPPARSQAAQAAQAAQDGRDGRAGAETRAEDLSYRTMVRSFSENYRIGPADSIAVRVKGQPDYSLEKVKVAPTGTIYHPLLGDILVAGFTLDQLKKQLTTELSEYLIDPVVSIELLEAQSAKVGVIGEVKAPKILLMSGPMTIIDAITEAGGFTDTGKKSEVTLLRQNPDGQRSTIKVNMKNILNGKAAPGENLALQAGDTVIVHGNALKAIPLIAGISGFGSLLSFISLGSR